MRNTFKYALVSVLWPAMVVSAQIASVKPYSEPDALDIYRALIAPQSKRWSPLLLSTTVEPKICSVSEKEITNPEFRQAMDAFHEVNEQVWDLSRVLSDSEDDK